MPRRKCLFLFFILLLFGLFEFLYLPKKNEEFTFISESISNVKEDALNEKEANLIQAYQFDDYLNYNIQYSKVLFRDVYHFNKEFTIYKGNEYGLKEDYLVVNAEGLVGVIDTVNKNTSIVRLLYNENTSLSVKVSSSYGILKCKNNELVIEGINNKVNIQVGDEVRISDISIYPEGILIGKVDSISYDKYEIEQFVTITPAVSFDSVSYVGIITDLRGEE